MSQPSAPDFRVEIAPWGDAVLMGADGRHPEGYLPLGRSWAIRKPSTLHDRWRRYEAAATSENKDASSAALALTELKAVWNDTLAPLIPDLTRLPPLSAAGMPGGGRILASLSDETGRKAQIESYAAGVQSRPAAPGVPAAIDLILRQLSILRLPCMGEARVRRRAPGQWMLHFVEGGPVEVVLGTPPAGRSPRLNSAFETAIAPLSDRILSGATAARVMAVARAVQLARIWTACWTSGMPRLDIEVQHRGLGGKALLLSIPADGWGLPLARLADRVSKSGQDGFPLPWPEAAGTGPTLHLVTPSASEPGTGGWHDHAPGVPVRWQAEDAGSLPRWTYAGTADAVEPACKDLPFALSPQRPPTGLDPQALREWLAGPRRQAGFRPEFALFYLQNLEYRLLAESGPSEERARLVAEVEAVAALLDAESPLAAQAGDLLDWLGATGRRALRPLAEERPLGVLVATAQKMLDGAPLQRDDICAIARCLPDHDDLGGAALSQTARRAIPESVQVKAPRVDLIASYRSITGLLDQQAHRFMHKGRPLPDLRVSARIRHLIATARTAAQMAVHTAAGAEV